MQKKPAKTGNPSSGWNANGVFALLMGNFADESWRLLFQIHVWINIELDIFGNIVNRFQRRLSIMKATMRVHVRGDIFL